MKRRMLYTLIMLLGWVATGFGQITQEAGQINPTNAETGTITAQAAGAVTNTSLLNIAVSPGAVYCNGSMSYLQSTTFSNLLANTTYFVKFYCPLEYLIVSTVAPYTNQIPIATVVCGATTCATITDNRGAINFPLVSNSSYDVPLGGDGCGLFASTGALGSAPTGGVNPGINRVAANQTVYQLITTAATNVVALDCNVNPLSKLGSAGKGATILSVDVYYGVQTTALTSITAPTISSNTYPAAGGAAADTVAAAGGALTTNPVSLQLTLTTTGQCFHENISLATPINVTTASQSIVLEQLFNQSAAAATQLQVCKVTVNYVNNPL